MVACGAFGAHDALRFGDIGDVFIPRERFSDRPGGEDSSLTSESLRRPQTSAVCLREIQGRHGCNRGSALRARPQGRMHLFLVSQAIKEMNGTKYEAGVLQEWMGGVSALLRRGQHSQRLQGQSEQGGGPQPRMRTHANAAP